MEFGSRPRLRSKGAVSAALLTVGLSVALAAIVVSSCADASGKRRMAVFSSSLGSIDVLVAKGASPGLDKAFSGAFKNARLPSDWLSILKRSKAADSAGDGGHYAKTADRALKAFPKSEAIAAAAAHAYLRGGRPADALALFDGPISPEARPELWAEAFMASRAFSAGFGGAAEPKSRVGAKSTDYGRLAEIIGDPRAFLGAAASSISAGDGASARSWIRKGLAGGAHSPPELLWDCRLFEELASRPDASASSAELELMGDAAWTTGDVALAKRRWERSISLSPKRSWKAYVDLALIAGGGETADSLWARLKAAFLSGPTSPERDGALGAYAAHLARDGRESEALAVIAGDRSGAASTRTGSAGEGGKGFLEVLNSTIKGRSEPEGRFAADLEHLAAERPEDPEVMGAVLRSLVIRGMFGEAAVLRERAARRGLPIAYGWYYDAMFLAARGDFPRAAETIADSAQIAGAAAGPAAYALGSVYVAMGDTAKAVGAFTRAAASARGNRERCVALKALGRALGDAGDSSGAAAAFRSAAAADPADSEAAVLARVVSGNR